MATKDFKTFNLVMIILIILGAAGAVGISYYGLKETPSISGTPQTNNPAETPTAISQNSAYQKAPSSVEVVWPTDQALNMEDSSNMENLSVSGPATPLPSSPVSSPVSQPSGVTGNQVLDTYLNAYQEAQKNKEPYKEVSFKATIYSSLPLRDFINGLSIKIDSGVYSNLDQTDYRAVFCYRAPNLVDRGLIFRFRRPEQIAGYRKIYDDVGAGLKNWEGNIFFDLKNAFFPESSFTNAPRFQEAAYALGSGVISEVKYASIKDQRGNNLFVGYNYQSERIYLANNLECLKRILDNYTFKIEPGMEKGYLY